MKLLSLILAIAAIGQGRDITKDLACGVHHISKDCKDDCHFCKNGAKEVAEKDRVAGCLSKETPCGMQGQLATVGMAAVAAALALWN